MESNKAHYNSIKQFISLFFNSLLSCCFILYSYTNTCLHGLDSVRLLSKKKEIRNLIESHALKIHAKKTTPLSKLSRLEKTFCILYIIHIYWLCRCAVQRFMFGRLSSGQRIWSSLGDFGIVKTSTAKDEKKPNIIKISWLFLKNKSVAMTRVSALHKCYMHRE